MKVTVTKQEMQLAVLAYFGLPINAEVTLESEELDETTQDISNVDSEDVVVVKQPRKRRRRKQNANTQSESSEEVQEVSPQVSADELAEQVESEVEPVNDTAFNEYPNVDGLEVQSETVGIEEEITAPRNDIEIPEFVGGTSDDDDIPFEVSNEDSLLDNTGGNDVSLFAEVIAETPEEDELPVNETPSLFL